MSPITIKRSTAFNMSYTVRSPTSTAVMASISTPVCPQVSHCAMQRTDDVASSNSKSTVTCVNAMGWQSGTNSAVFLLAMMAAMRATPITSPFLAVPALTSANVSGFIRMRPAARASRFVSAFAPTSTICACPAASKCVSSAIVMSNLYEIVRKCCRRP